LAPLGTPLTPRRLAGALALAALAAFVVWWIAFGAETTALDDPANFVFVLLNGITLAALYFLVASGFTLIFGLMRVVNMAHGAFFLLGGYIALTLQRRFVGQGDVSLLSEDVGFLRDWLAPLAIACVFVAALGVGTQQVLLRWNQGQDLRQALITIAVAVIVADFLVEPLGVAKGISFPGSLDKFVDLRVAGVQYSLSRLFIVAVAVVVGVALWLWLKKTRTGMIVRAGVDDRQMVSALGINIQRTFAIAFAVGSALAALGGVMGGSFASLATGVDGIWLLNSLVVVIIGGMGSLGGAAIGALLYGLVSSFSPAYLPSEYTSYSIIFTFVLLAVVLAVRPLGLFGRPA